MIFSRAVARIEPLPLSQWPSEMRDALAALDPPVRRHPRPQREGRPKALNALGTLARYPALTQAFHTFNGHILFATTLSPRQRELLVLRVAALRDAPYEWAQHVVQGTDAGITREEISRIGTGPYPQSVFYTSTGTYNLGHTCNTWTAEALRVAGLPVNAAGVVFAGQVLDQLPRILEADHDPIHRTR